MGLTAVAYGLLGGGADSLPGLMLVGAGAAGLGVPALLERSARPGPWLAGVGAAGAVPPLAAYHAAGGGDPRFSAEGPRAGPVTAIAYIGPPRAATWRSPPRVRLEILGEPGERLAHAG